MCWSFNHKYHTTMAHLAGSSVPYDWPLVRLRDVGWLFLQDHRENGQLQPDHPGDSPSFGAAGGNSSLYYQPAEPLQLHQRRRHTAGEERPAAANTTSGRTWSADHYNPLHKLVCMAYIAPVNTYITIKVCCHCKCKSSSLRQVRFIFFCYTFCSVFGSAFLFSSLSILLRSRRVWLFVCQVLGEPAASSQQLSHRPLPYAALLCQPEHRQRAEFPSGGVFRCSRSDPELMTVYYSFKSFCLTLLFIITGFYWD